MIDDGAFGRGRWQAFRDRRTLDLLVHNGKQVCNWITPLKSNYAEGELVDISRDIVNARALRWATPSQDELRDIDNAKWIWAANSNGLPRRRLRSLVRILRRRFRGLPGQSAI
ncbi:MAG: hypothetical protein ACI9G1_002857 [Pirellulaceae bacterium]|jgi:hypothetical protein